MSFLTGTNVELIYSSTSPGTAKNTFTTEVQINDTAGMGVQAKLPPDFWLPQKGEIGRGIRIHARGILSTTGAPTFTWTIRFGAAGNITLANVLGTAATVTATGAANAMWELEGDIIMENMGAVGVNSTVRGLGLVSGPALNPAVVGAFGGGVQPGTVASVDTSITNFINFNVACGTSSLSNSIQLLQLLVFGLN